MHFEVFIHKVDGLSDEHKLGLYCIVLAWYGMAVLLYKASGQKMPICNCDYLQQHQNVLVYIKLTRVFDPRSDLIDTTRDVHQRVHEELEHAGLSDVNVRYEGRLIC